MKNKLTVFLLGTTDHHSSLRILHGQEDILRMIWIYACSEWWSYHIQHYQIPDIYDPNNENNDLQDNDPDNIADLRNHTLFTRKKFFDCPLAILQENVLFPPLSSLPNSKEPILVNMMPFDLFDPVGTLPPYLYGYVELIESCRNYVKAYSDFQYSTGEKEWPSNQNEFEHKRIRLNPQDPNNRIAYLTVDERPVSEVGRSQRRGGVHVESPGALREKEIANKSQYTPDLSYYHHWGQGFATDEYLVGGIFIASNVSDTTAVWNTRIHDTFGDIIGPHGSLERMKGLLGPPTKRLSAGELVWLSDRTPHESLPLTDTSVRRQFFRLVVGEIGFWFADHNTSNPTGYPIPESVPIIHGNKFELVRSKVPVVWECGDAEEIAVAKEEVTFREKLYEVGVGFLADELLKIGIYNPLMLCDNRDRWLELVKSLDEQYYSSETRSFIECALDKIEYNYREENEYYEDVYGNGDDEEEEEYDAVGDEEEEYAVDDAAGDHDDEEEEYVDDDAAGDHDDEEEDYAVDDAAGDHDDEEEDYVDDDDAGDRDDEEEDYVDDDDDAGDHDDEEEEYAVDDAAGDHDDEKEEYAVDDAAGDHDDEEEEYAVDDAAGDHDDEEEEYAVDDAAGDHDDEEEEYAVDDAAGDHDDEEEEYAVDDAAGDHDDEEEDYADYEDTADHADDDE